MLKVALQMDPMPGINPQGDSTWLLGIEAQKRGYELFHYTPDHLSLRVGCPPLARGHALGLAPGQTPHYRLGAEQTRALTDFDVIWLRQDPPFDLAYISSTHILEHVRDQVLVVNDPVAVRNAPEKLLVTRYADLMPPTLISADRRDIAAFRAEQGEIILKPLYGNGGRGVFHLRPDDDNFGAVLDVFFAPGPGQSQGLGLGREPIMAQKYLPEIKQGDKRIILIEGKAVGAVNRIPKPGDARANLHVGGAAERGILTQRDQEICARIGGDLRDLGLVFVGIDVIGGYLTEINVTSPTCLYEINQLDQTCLEAKIWDAVLARLAARKK
ncbi:MAG: glutathione synthase [Candidatus Symbiobacter sp.]|nr:glutathione synthase [Candidatus Symbiobacter sp.]